MSVIVSVTRQMSSKLTPICARKVLWVCMQWASMLHQSGAKWQASTGHWYALLHDFVAALGGGAGVRQRRTMGILVEASPVVQSTESPVALIV